MATCLAELQEEALREPSKHPWFKSLTKDEQSILLINHKTGICGHPFHGLSCPKPVNHEGSHRSGSTSYGDGSHSGDYHYMLKEQRRWRARREAFPVAGEKPC